VSPDQGCCSYQAPGPWRGATGLVLAQCHIALASATRARPGRGSFLAEKHMRAATALDLASVSDFPEFHTLAEQDLTNHILSIDP
jgi:hypothetical protein